MSVVARRVVVWKGVRRGQGEEEGEEEAELAACWDVLCAAPVRLLLCKGSRAIPPAWQQLNQGDRLLLGL